MIAHCEKCDAQVCDCYDAETVDGKLLCDRCIPKGTVRCGECLDLTAHAAVKNEGIRCIKCAHKLELELLGGEHDVAACPICK